MVPYSTSRYRHERVRSQGTLEAARTRQVAVLLALRGGEGHQLPQQQGVLQHPLDRLNEVGLQGGRVLLGGVPRFQELLESSVRFGWTGMKID